MSEDKDASVLSRWSRRKHLAIKNSANTQTTEQENLDRLVTQELELDEQLDLPSTADNAKPDQVQAAELVTTDQDASEEPLLSDEDMPELSTLSSQSDVSMFFNKGVSATLRKAALKTIFGLPQYNIRDGLNDYDEDYTVFEPLGDTVTCDMKFHQARKEREEREALEREAAEQESAEDAEVQEQIEASSEDEALTEEQSQDGAENDDSASDDLDESDQPSDDDNTEDLHANRDKDLTETNEKSADV